MISEEVDNLNTQFWIFFLNGALYLKRENMKHVSDCCEDGLSLVQGEDLQTYLGLHRYLEEGLPE